MLVDKESELMSDLLFTVHQHGGDDVSENDLYKLWLFVLIFMVQIASLFSVKSFRRRISKPKAFPYRQNGRS